MAICQATWDWLSCSAIMQVSYWLVLGLVLVPVLVLVLVLVPVLVPMLVHVATQSATRRRSVLMASVTGGLRKCS